MQDVLGDATAADLAAAWRLAFAVCGERTGADAAAEAAVAAQVSWLGPPSPIELLSATYREVEPIGFASLPGSRDDPLHDAWWVLPVDQRAALWLRLADKRSSTVVAEILSLAPGAVTSLVNAAQDQMVPTPPSGACPNRADLTAYVAGSLPAEEKAVVAEHVPGCDACADRLALVERLQSLGDPESGPVPIATDAGRLALDKYLLAGAGAWDGDLIDEEPVRRPEATAPEPPVSPPLPIAPLHPASPPLGPPPPVTDSSPDGPKPTPRSPAGAADRGSRGRSRTAATPETQRGTVAASALAAFRAALGDEDLIDDVDVPVSDGPSTAEVPVLVAAIEEPGSPHRRPSELGGAIPRWGGFAPQSSPNGSEATEGEPPSPVPPPPDGKSRGRFGRLRHRRSEAASEFAPSEFAPSEFAPSESAPSEAAPSEFAPSEFAPEEFALVEAALGAALTRQADEGPPTEEDEGPPTEETEPVAVPGAGEQAWPLADWAPDDRAWASLAGDDDKGDAVDDAPTAEDPPPSLRASEPPSRSVPEGAIVPWGREGDEAETVADDGEQHPGPGFLRRRPLGASLYPKVLAVATAGVLAAGIVGAIVVHHKGLPRFETVNVRGSSGPALFPGGDPATVTPPSSTPLIIIPPGATQSTFPPGSVPSSSPFLATGPSSPSSAAPQTSPPTSGHSSHTSGGYSGPTGGLTPPAVTPPKSTTTTTTPPRPTTTTTTPSTTPPPTSPTTFCILFICN